MDGFTAKSSTGTTTYDSVTRETAPTGGDESLATAATFACRGAAQTLRTQTLRFGDTIANYFAMNTTAFLQGRTGNRRDPGGPRQGAERQARLTWHQPHSPPESQLLPHPGLLTVDPRRATVIDRIDILGLDQVVRA